ncbi:MAG: nucleoside-diphosphate kinase, partial [Nitrososphaeraceae archaeon]
MSNLEQTLIVVKPDAFKKGIVGKIISRFEEKGFQIMNLKSFQFDIDTARK